MPSKAILASISSLADSSQAYAEKLNTVSEDIKQVEASLQSWNIGVSAYVTVSRQSLSPEEREIVTERPIRGWQFINAYAQESLSWERDRQSGKYRVIYCRTLFEDRVSTGAGDAPSGEFSSSPFGCNQFPDGITESKPLIECPIDVRLRAWKVLPDLVHSVEKAVGAIVEEGTA